MWPDEKSGSKDWVRKAAKVYDVELQYGSECRNVATIQAVFSVRFVFVPMIVYHEMSAFDYLIFISSGKIKWSCRVLPTELFRPILCDDGFVEMTAGSSFFTWSLLGEAFLTIFVHSCHCHLTLTGPVSFVRHFSYKDIKKATGSFCRIIYHDTHGAAYRANFDDAGLALVKEVKEFDQSKEVFYREVQLLGRLHHRHLLALRGFSMEKKRYGPHLGEVWKSLYCISLQFFVFACGRLLFKFLSWWWSFLFIQCTLIEKISLFLWFGKNNIFSSKLLIFYWMRNWNLSV